MTKLRWSDTESKKDHEIADSAGAHNDPEPQHTIPDARAQPPFERSMHKMQARNHCGIGQDHPDNERQPAAARRQYAFPPQPAKQQPGIE